MNGWMDSSRDTANISFVFVQVYMRLQLCSEPERELKVEITAFVQLYLSRALEDYKPRPLNNAACNTVNIRHHFRIFLTVCSQINGKLNN
jgi:hypothetical protein